MNNYLRKHNKKYKDGGFTLVEMIVTLVVLGIVITLTAMGILAWQDWSRFNQQNEYAQTLFVAAQNQLAEFTANGRIVELQDSLSDNANATHMYGAKAKSGFYLNDVIDKLVAEDGSGYDLATLFPESDGKAQSDLYQDEILSLRAETGDYAQYLANPAAFKATNPEAYWVFELVGAYVYDVTILNGEKDGGASICIEITPEDGQVFSVLYSNRNDRLIYLGMADSKGAEESNRVSDISNRMTQYRKERMVGYYGVDTLYASTKNEMIRPSIARVKLVNKETFYLTCKLSTKYKNATQKLTYTIDLDASKNINDKKLTLELDGSKLKNSEHAEAIDCPVYRYDDAGESVSIGTFPVLAWVSADNTIHVIYDAADIQANTFQYESDLDSIRSNTADVALFSNTYSFFRFGVDLDDVYATVQARGDGYTDSKPASNFGNVNILKNQNGKNPCFASCEKEVQGTDAKYTYSIINGRHLYNIRYIEDISYEKEAAGYQNIDKVTGTTFNLKNDIDFAKFQAEGYLLNSEANFLPTDSKIALSGLDGKIYSLKDQAISEVTRRNCEFPTFKQLRMNDTFDGKNMKLKGIKSSELSNVVYMVYTKKDTANNTISLSDNKPIGLFNVNYGALKNLSMDDFSIKGSDMVGAFCGANAGLAEKITTLNTNKLSRVSGVKNVGGIMGFQIMMSGNTTVKGLVNRADVYGTEAVGGIFGMVRNNFKDFDFSSFDLTVAQLNDLKSNQTKVVLIEQCNNYGPVYGYTKSDLKGVYVQSKGPSQEEMPDSNPEKIRYIGGIVGYCYNYDKNDTDKLIISNCVSSPQYSGDDLNSILSSKAKLEAKLKGDYVGGIAGYNYYGTIRNCSTKSEKGTIGCIFGYRYVGGVVGLNMGPVGGIYGGDTSNKGINENHVIGCYYVGGITGANADVKDEAVSYETKEKVSSKDPEVLSGHDAILEPISARSYNVIIENWTNRGVVIATKAYAGGITGYNTGWVYRCLSEVSATNVDAYFNTLSSTIDLGDYCGGIAGYNNGVIGNTKRNPSNGKKDGENGKTIAAEVYVNGHNYTGGIVGYNDVDSIVEDYQVASGYVRGYAHKFDDNAKSCFVGGYAGLNSSVDLLMDLEAEPKEARFIYSNPNLVTGDYFVGGTIGGNMINTNNFNKGVDLPDTNLPLDMKNAYDSILDDTKASVVIGCDNILSAFPRTDYVMTVSFDINNNTGKTISGWRIPFDKSIEISDWAEGNLLHLWNNGVACDLARNEFYPQRANTALLNNGNTKLQLRIYGSKAQLEAFKDKYDNQTTGLYYGFADNNATGTYSGIAPTDNDVKVSYVLKKDGRGNNLQYDITIKNNTAGALPNWRIEVDIPEGVTVDGNAQDCTIQQKGNVLGVVGKHDRVFSLGAGESVKISLHANFPNSEQKELFKQSFSSLRVLFNNVLYSGEAPKTNPDPSNPGTPGEKNNILAQYKTDNFLGVLEGEEFVGGYIGYNLLIENDDKETWVTKNEEAEKGAVYNLQKLLVNAFAKSDKEDTGKVASLAHKKAILDDLNAALGTEAKESPSTILISGKEQESTKTEFGNIVGQVYVGGVLGYNDDNTSMIVQNVENATPVIAESAIEYAEEQLLEDAENGALKPRTKDYNDNDFTYTYSYAGGIIGRVSKHTIIDHCWNSSSGSVKTLGTYTGGLCEINEGIIRNCDVTNLGSGVDDYFGGLCGLNKKTGIIQDCHFDKKTVSGRNVVGGIAAENFGTIQRIEMNEPKINALAISGGSRDGVAGLYAGVNGQTGIIELESDLKNVFVNSDGCYAGAVSGVNYGSIENKKIKREDISFNLEISGEIKGYYDVGALVGLNKDTNATHVVQNYTSVAKVEASNGNAGGIIGENASSNTIIYCANLANVSATIGNAGGITSVNRGVIQHCFDYSTVVAPKGMCGGIVAYNGDRDNKDAVIEYCFVGGPSDVEFKSGIAVGGIAAKNYGVIQRNTLKNVISTNRETNVLHTSIGCLVGDNETTGRVFIENTKETVKDANGVDVLKTVPGVIDCKAIATTNNCNVGGVTGTNDGLVSTTAAEEGYALIGAEELLEGAKYASLGGVAGLNTGTISNCQVVAVINGDLGTSTTGYGGIVGYNGYSTKSLYEDGKKRHAEDANYRVQILNCTFDGYLRADGSAGNPANVGGMTGVNGYGGYIKDCAIGVRSTDITGGHEDLETTIVSGNLDVYGKKRDTAYNTVTDTDTNSYAYIGGIAGRNYADITDIDMKAKSVDNAIKVLSFAGSIGGMVGYQYEDASLNGYKEGETIHWITTPESMKVEMMLGENDYGVGGIIGYDRSGKDIAYLMNYANVVNYVNTNVKTGGIIGTIEQQDIAIVNVSNCVNYGKVEGRVQVGGIFGRTKYCSVNMEDCVNYGEVYASAGCAGGLISRIYDINNSYIYMTHCINYGFVHAKGTNYVGGFLGFVDSSKNITAYIYDCDNVGIVERDDAANFPIVKPATKVQNTVGSFVGNGNTVLWNIEQCQNYNHSASANGLIGNQGTAKIKDCLDDSNSKTNSNRLTPILGNGVSSTSTGLTSSTMQNVYYLDETSRNTAATLSNNGGAYFTYDRVTNFANYWNGQHYKDLNNPGLFLETPNPHTYMQQANNTNMEFQVAYDYSKCKGIKAFNIYFWNGKMDNTVSVSTKYTVTATFTDKNGKSASVVEVKNGVTNVFADNKLSLEVPAELDHDIRDINIKVSGGTAYYHGFSYDAIDGSGNVKEFACSYISNKTDTTFHVADLVKTATVRSMANGTSVPKDIKFVTPDDYLKYHLGDHQWIRFDRSDIASTYDISFDVTGGNGLEAFVFYPSNDNTSASPNMNKVKTYYYDYVVTFTDENDNTVDVVGKRAENTAAIGYDSLINSELFDAPAIVKVPDDFSKKIKNIKLSFTDSVTVTPEKPSFSGSGNNFYVRGFGYIPYGSSTPCYTSNSVDGTKFHITSFDLTEAHVKKADSSTNHSVDIADDYLGHRYGQLEVLKFNKNDNSGLYKMIVDVNQGKEPTGMRSFVFYPCNDRTKTEEKDINQRKTYTYTYNVVFVNKEGIESAPVEGEAIGYDYLDHGAYNPVIVNVPSGFENATRFIFTISDIKYTQADKPGSTPTMTSSAFFRGFGWIPSGSTEIEPMGVGDLPANTPGAYESFGRITKLYCDYSGNGGTPKVPYVYTEFDYNTGFNMGSNDPAADAYYKDVDLYADSVAKADGSASRLNVYKDIHPKFTTFVEKQYVIERKLNTPVPSVVDEDGMYKVSWAPVPGAYEYEIKYYVKDSDGNTVAESPRIYSVGGGTTSYAMPSGQEAWIGSEVTFCVRAVNAYRYQPTDANKKYDYDSEWGPAKIIAKKVLPQPEVHLEITAENNTVAILDNREDYALESGKGYMDCVVEVTFNATEVFYIYVKDGFVSSESNYLSNHAIGSDFTMFAKAKPTDETVDYFSESSEFYLRGHFVDNELLEVTPQYPGIDSNNNIDFRGFYGKDANQMTYSVYYTVDSRDSFVKADIVSYDKELGMEVSYSSMETHTAATSGKTYFTATLSDLPVEWFAEDFAEDIVVRSYINSSQYHYLYYGHTVAENVEEKDIHFVKDPYHLIDDGSSIMQEDVSIFDENGDLKPGYTVQRKFDENGNKIYDIFYNANIELAKKAIAGKDPNYVYYNYCVGYKQYKAGKTDVKVMNSGSTNLSVEEPYADINTYDYQETYMTRNAKNGTLTNGTWPTDGNNLNIMMQEIQPAPMIDREFKDEIVGGHKSYTFTFDEFYKDSYCMTTGGKTNYYNSNADNCITRASADVAPTWAAFLQKSGFNSESSLDQKLRIMNAYYYTYLNAEYRVDLIGRTLDGEEATIATEMVKGATYLEGKDVPNSYKVGATDVNTVYQRYNYQVTFTDVKDNWNEYSDLTIRVMRLGTTGNMISESGITPKQSKAIASYQGSTFALPRYSDYKIHVLMKLNTINNPTAYLHQENGSYVTDSLMYDISYGAITNANQLNDLGGYLITAKVITPKNPADVVKPHYYYVKEYDTSIEGNDIGIDATALSAAGILKEIDGDSEYQVNGNSRTAQIDLSDFNTGDVVQITIKAIASTKAENYIDGDEGNGVEVTISERLSVPNISLLSIDTASGMNDQDLDALSSVVDLDTYKKGFYLSYGDDPNYSGSAYANASMKMAVAVFDTCPNRTSLSKVEVGDDKAGNWNDGAIKTFYPKNKALSMGYISAHTKTQIDLANLEEYPGQYAGKWLKIALKATSTSRISSKWTDEDMDDATVNYLWIHIPKLQLDAVSVKDAQANTDPSKNAEDITRYYVSSMDAWYDKAEDVPENKQSVAVNMQTIELAEDNCLDGYNLQIVSNDISVSENNIDCSLPVYTIEIRKHYTNEANPDTFDGTMDVYLKDISYSKHGMAGEVLQSADEGRLIGNFSRTGEQIIPITDITADYNYNGSPMQSMAQIRYIPAQTGKNGIYQLMLPDITVLDDVSYCDDTTSFKTSDVLVEPYLKAVANPVYTIGDAAIWRRTDTDVMVNGVPQKIYGTEIIPVPCAPATDISDWFDSIKEKLKNYSI